MIVSGKPVGTRTFSLKNEQTNITMARCETALNAVIGDAEKRKANMRGKPAETGMWMNMSSVITVCCSGASDLYGIGAMG